MRKLLFLIVCAGCIGARVPASGQDFTGRYESVTESDCNVELLLAERGRATIVQRCRLKGSGQDTRTTTPATWASSGNEVVIAYGQAQDTLRFSPALSHADYGRNGSSPGLELIAPDAPESRLEGYGKLWKR